MEAVPPASLRDARGWRQPGFNTDASEQRHAAGYSATCGKPTACMRARASSIRASCCGCAISRCCKRACSPWIPPAAWCRISAPPVSAKRWSRVRASPRTTNAKATCSWSSTSSCWRRHADARAGAAHGDLPAAADHCGGATRPFDLHALRGHLAVAATVAAMNAYSPTRATHRSPACDVTIGMFAGTTTRCAPSL